MTKVIHINNIKLAVEHDGDALFKAVRREGITCSEADITIKRKSLDARDKSRLQYIYTLELPFEKSNIGKRAAYSKRITIGDVKAYREPERLDSFKGLSPVIAGAGPAGLFAGLILAKAGLFPVIIERGKPVEERRADIDAFWSGRALDTESNVCFGEGGAGTYSDGKLYTGNKDRYGWNAYILDTFVRCGADDELKYWYQPHIGSDRLPLIIKRLRQEIIACGGSFCYETKLTDVIADKGAVSAISIMKNGQQSTINCDTLILAAGHGADDIYKLLHFKNANLKAKPFAIGLRIEHPQSQIQAAQYGTDCTNLLPAASYKLVARVEDRSAFSFCMCPGGHVVNASTENGTTVVNGMSLSGRDGRNANSAIVISVSPTDYPGDHPLAGLEYRKRYEEAAFKAGCGGIPVQTFGDFLRGSISKGFGDITPDICGEYRMADLNKVLSAGLSGALKSAIKTFSETIPGFDRDDAVLSGVESRTSSPVQIMRDEFCESNIKGLFPCGEGAGYAGGIMSAAADGIRVAHEVIRRKANE